MAKSKPEKQVEHNNRWSSGRADKAVPLSGIIDLGRWNL